MHDAVATAVPSRPAASPGEPDAHPVVRVVDALPRVAAFALAALGLVGTPLLLAGRFDRLPVLLGTGVLFVLLELGWRRRGPRRGVRGPAIISLLALLVALGSVGANARWSSQHLLVDGDPAVYAVTGQLIARAGSVVVPTQSRHVFGGVPSFNYAGAGFDASPDTATVRPTFLHLLPEALAVASWVGGPRALLTANALLAGFSLLAVFAFGARLVRPVWSLVAMTALAVSLPQLHFSRDTFSEIPAQLLLFAGLTLLYDVTRRRERLRSPLLPGLVAGLVLGASCIARIDAFFYLVPLTVFLTVLAVAGAARLAAGVAGGVLVAAALGYVDLRAASPRYLELQAANLHLIWAALAAVVLAAVATLVWRDRALALWERLPRPALGTAAGGLIVVLGLFAYFARPHLQTAHNIPDGQPTAVEALQQAEGLAVQPGRSYDELSLHWLGWYLGPVALALGILGFALLVRRALRTRDGSLPGLAFLLVFGASSLLYLWKPSIIPVQYWATRRYLPATVPGLLLCAAWLPNISGSWRRLRPPVGVVVAVSLLAAPLWFLRGHATDREYVPMLDATARICAALQPDDAVVILGRPPMSTGMPQTIGAFCHVPVAVVSDPTTNRELATAYRAAHAAGRRLVYLSPTPSTSLPDGPVAGSFRQLVDTTVSVEALSLLHRPDGRFTFPFTVWFAAAPPPAA